MLNPSHPIRYNISYQIRKLVRTIENTLSSSPLAHPVIQEILPVLILEHSTPIFRKLSGVDSYLFENKKVNLKIAIKSLNQVTIKPGEIFSFWNCVGKPSAHRGYLPGLVIKNGRAAVDVGGGLCQISNSLHWLALHTEMIVTERHRHSFDIFPDDSRKVPFGTGATVVYNYKDLRLHNQSKLTYQFVFQLSEDHLIVQLRGSQVPQVAVTVTERNESFSDVKQDQYRSNEIWRQKRGQDGHLLSDEKLFSNYCLCRYNSKLILNILIVLFAINSKLSFSVAAEGSAHLLAASATSRSTDSAAVTCLLDPTCHGYWAPQVFDGANDEGIYFQFEEQTSFDFIEVIFSNVFDTHGRLSVIAYLDGKTTTKKMQVLADWSGAISPSGEMRVVIGSRSSDFVGLSPLNTQARSVYLKIQNNSNNNGKPLRINRINFYRSSQNLTGDDPVGVKLSGYLPVILPKLVSVNVKSSSVLEPEFAYHPSHLFDSQVDFAWSTNGKISKGIDETIDVSFSSAQIVNELLIWNGYQRSQQHFLSNGRVSVLEIKSDTSAESQIIALQDKLGAQAIKLVKPISVKKNLNLKIKGIYPGSKYKDILISEMLFKDNLGSIILPVPDVVKIEVPLILKDFVDRSFASFFHQVFYGQTGECGGECKNSSIKLRSNGTFIVYNNFDYGKSNNGEVSANVIEGNWENHNGVIRIFGKKYATSLRSSEYLQGSKEGGQASIFQSDMTLIKYASMTTNERMKLLNFLFKNMPGSKNTNQTDKVYWTTGLVNKKTSAVAESLEMTIDAASEIALLKKVDEEVKKRNPFYIKSSVFTGLVLPVSEIHSCISGC